MLLTHPDTPPKSETPYLALAPFLRMSIAGQNLEPLAQQMLAQAQDAPGDAHLWMNLSTVMQCLGQRAIGLALQDQALALQRIYHRAASEQPVRLRLLVLMVPGDLAANIPLDCLLEQGDIDLDFYYLSPDQPLALPLPEHDALIVALSESDENHALLSQLAQALADWPQPVINAPQYIPRVGRDVASALLQNVPGLLMPPTLRAARAQLQAIASGVAELPALFEDCDFPLILRPRGSQGGRDLAKIESPADMARYLARVNEAEFYLSRFIDYSGADGLFRKIRVALIDGVALACHMAVSSNWMIHYVNAGMYAEAWKRDEEAAFMAHFADFAQQHKVALDAIYHRTQLDYLFIDCAQTPEGQLLVFEIDHAMVVHAMDPEAQFPYKQTHMRKVRSALRDYLLRLTLGRKQP